MAKMQSLINCVLNIYHSVICFQYWPLQNLVAKIESCITCFLLAAVSLLKTGTHCAYVGSASAERFSGSDKTLH